MSKKLKICITALVCVVLAIWIFTAYSARPVIKAPYSMAYDIERKYTDDGGSGASFKTVDDNFFFLSQILYEGEDVTERFDPEELAEFLSGCMSRRASQDRGSADMLWSIDIIYKHRPIHICLGQTPAGSSELVYYWYESADKGHYKILDPDAMLDALERMMKPA